MKALVTDADLNLTVAAQEREAHASEEYAAAVKLEAKAAALLEEVKAARAHARLKIEIWRVIEGSHRTVFP